MPSQLGWRGSMLSVASPVGDAISRLSGRSASPDDGDAFDPINGQARDGHMKLVDSTTGAYEPEVEHGDSIPETLLRIRSSSHEATRLGHQAPLRSEWMVHMLEEDAQTAQFGRKFVFTEASPLRVAWSALVIFLLSYTGTIFPYRLAFVEFRIDPPGRDDNVTSTAQPEGKWDQFDDFVTVAFWMDLVANFFFSYKDIFGREIDNLRLVVRHYLQGSFFINLVACIPEEWVYDVIMACGSSDHVPQNVNQAARQLRLQRVSRLARLIRLTRLAKLQSHSKNNFIQWLSTRKGVRVINLVVGFLWVVHILACGWYICAALHDDPTNTWVSRRHVDSVGDRHLIDCLPWEQWLQSMYFILTVVTTIGFGDIAAVTTGEILYVCFTEAIGAVIHSIIISEVINVVTSNDKNNEFVKKQAKLVEAFAEHTHLDPQSRESLNTWISVSARYWAPHQYEKDEMKLLITGSYMPRSLLGRLPYMVFGGALIRNSMFSRCREVGGGNLPPRLMLLLALAVHRSEFGAGEVIYQVNDFPFNLFLVLRGTFASVGQPSPQGGLAFIPPPLAPRPPPDAVGHVPSGVPPLLLKAGGKLLGGRQGPRGGVEALATGPKLFPFQLFSAGSYFGDVELFLGQPRQTTVRSERDGGLVLSLHKNELLPLTQDFPNFGKRWKSAAKHHAAVRLRRQARLTRGYSYRHLAAVTIQGFWRAWSSGSWAVAELQAQVGTPMGPRISSKRGSVIEMFGGGGGIKELRQEVQDLHVTVDDLRKEVGEVLQTMRAVFTRSI